MIPITFCSPSFKGGRSPLQGGIFFWISGAIKSAAAPAATNDTSSPEPGLAE